MLRSAASLVDCGGLGNVELVRDDRLVKQQTV
jgi:hypothetical protein